MESADLDSQPAVKNFIMHRGATYSSKITAASCCVSYTAVGSFVYVAVFIQLWLQTCE